MPNMFLCCINQYRNFYPVQRCCSIPSNPQMLYQEPVYAYENDYKHSRHKFGGVKTILKSKNYLETEQFILTDSDLSCTQIKDCRWSNDPFDSFDWIVIDNESGYVKNLFPEKFLQNGNEYLLASTNERPSHENALLVSDPINCQSTYGYLSFKCFISQPKDIGTPPVLEICTKIVKQNDLSNCQKVYPNPNYYVHAKIPKIYFPFNIVIKASNFDNPVEGGLIAIHEIRYEIGKDGIINSCELENSIDQEENHFSLFTDTPLITMNYGTTEEVDNFIDHEYVKEIEPSSRIYPLPKNKENDKNNDFIESSDLKNEHFQWSPQTKGTANSESNTIIDYNNIFSLAKLNSNNKDVHNKQNSNYDESKMSCDVVKCSPERLAKETNCLYNNFIISSDSEESLGSGWEVVLVDDSPSHEFLRENYYKKIDFIENLFLAANFYGIDSPTYIFESPNINFDNSEDLYLSFQRHISIKGTELVVCGNKNGSNCFWSSEGDDIKDEWIIEHVPLIPGLSNIVFIAKSNYNVSPQTIGQVGLFDIKMYIKKNDSLVLYC